MIRVGGDLNIGAPGEDSQYLGLYYPDGDEITKHMAERLKGETFYQFEKFMQAMRAVKNRRVAVECGAWVGAWSRGLAGHFDRVIAIEANPANARCARRNLADYSNVTVVHAALGDRRDVVAIARQQGDGPNMGSYVRPLEVGGIVVPQWPLDELPEIRALEHLDYMKVHVNGSELRSLMGARSTIAKHRPVMTVVIKKALADYGNTPAQVRNYLTDVLRYKPAGGERPYEIWEPV